MPGGSSNTARCWVPGCVNNKVFERLSSNVKLFKFPSGDLARCRKWVKALGSEELLSCSSFQLRNKTVCEAHFRDYEIRKNAFKTTLVTSAVPSQFSPGVLPLPDEVVEQWPLQKENQSGGQLDSSVFHMRQPLAVSTPGPLKERETNHCECWHGDDDWELIERIFFRRKKDSTVVSVPAMIRVQSRPKVVIVQ